ncbi:MAG: MaoC/PaaZ C-terminal domain-containing protein [Microlunatus sp.]
MSGIDITQVAVGDQLPGLSVHFTRQTLVRYAGASTDFNPIHYSNFYAAQVGLPGVIAHGMLTMGSALRLVTDWVGDPTRVRSYFVRFTKPVVVPDDADGTEVAFSGVVSAIDGSEVTISIEAIADEVKVLGAARAVVDLGA